MKNIIDMTMHKVLAVMLISLSFLVSCETAEFDDTEIWEAIEEIEHRLDSMEQAVAANVSAIQSMASLGSITSWDYDVETGKGVITLLDGKTITIDQSVSGYSLITLQKGEDGKYYWAVCNDGVTELLVIDGKNVPVSVTPGLKVSDDGKWLISVDGGKTWVETGIAYQGQAGGAGVSFFSDVKKDGDFLILTLADGTEIKVEIVGEAGITVASDKMWFSRILSEKSVAVDMVNVKSFTITEKPEGWKAYIEDEAYLHVIAPDNFEDYPKAGTVKVLALFAGGLSPEIISVDVAYEPSFSIALEDGQVAVSLSEYTGEEFTGYLLAAWKTSDYTEESAVAYFNAQAATLVPYTGADVYQMSEIVENFEAAGKYTVALVPYLPPQQVEDGDIAYVISDLQTVKYEPTAECSITDVRYDSATLTITLPVESYYGGFMKYENWKNFGMENFLETLGYGGGEVCTTTSYTGPASAFPYGGEGEDINPATEYVIWYIPANESGVYKEDDFVTYTFKTPDVTADASIAAPTYVASEITSSGFTAEVTPASGAYKTYAGLIKSDALPDTDAAMVKYLIDVNEFSSASAVNTVSKYSFSPEDDVYIAAVSVTQDGRYGAVLKEQVELKPLVFDESLGVEVTAITHGVGDVTLSLSFTGEPVEMTYMAASYNYFTDTETERLMALGQLGQATDVKISTLDGKLVVSDLSVGTEYTFYAVVKDADDKCSRLYKYVFIPELNIDYILSDDEDYEYGMPQLSATMSGNTCTLDVDMPETCSKYWLFSGDSEYFTGDPWTDSDSLVTMEKWGVTEHTSSESGLKYTMATSVSRIYMVWLDKNGEYHAIYEFNPRNP